MDRYVLISTIFNALYHVLHVIARRVCALWMGIQSKFSPKYTIMNTILTKTTNELEDK